MDCAEFGTVSLQELAEFRGRAGLGIERDKFFEATAPISRYIDAASKAGRIVENLPSDVVATDDQRATTHLSPLHRFIIKG